MNNTTKKKYTGLNSWLKSSALQTLLDSKEDGSIRQFLDDWKWIFQYSKKYQWAIIVYTVFGIISSTLGLGSAVFIKYMIDIIVNRKVEQLWFIALFMVFSTLFSLLFSSIYQRLAAKISIHVNNDIQANIFEKVMDAEWMALNQYSSGDLANRFSNDIRSVANNAVNWIPSVIIQVYTFIATFVVICYYDVTMALISFLSAPFLLLSGRYILRKIQGHKQKVLKVNSQVMAFQVEAFYNYDTIKSFGVTDQYNEKLKMWQKEYETTNLEYNLFSIKSNVWMKLLGTAVSFVAFGYCLFRLWTGSITYGTMTLFLQQRSKLSTNFDALVKILPEMVNSSVAAHRIRKIAELPKERHDLGNAEQLEKTASKGLAIQMKDVDFSYVENKKVLTKSRFLAKPGEIAALVGPSGEGKTTILRMILGLIYPQNGEVTIRDTEGNEVSANADLRELFSYVPQGNTLFSGTIADNLKLAKEDTPAENPMIDKALNAANIQKTERSVSIVTELLAHQQPVNEAGIRHYLSLSAKYPELPVKDLILMELHHIPVTKENVEQF